MISRNRRRSAWAGLIIAFSLSSAHASPPPAAAACGACHGPRGEGNPELGAPAIAGQQAAYLERQLLHFRKGLRGSAKGDARGAQMRAAITAVASDAELKALATHYAALPATTPSRKAKGDLGNGQTRYLGNCGACHGAKAEGNAALNAPRLAGLDADYLRRQYQAFQANTRGADPKDRPGRQMQLMAGTLPTAKDLEDVIAYIQAQGAVR